MMANSVSKKMSEGMRACAFIFNLSFSNRVLAKSKRSLFQASSVACLFVVGISGRYRAATAFAFAAAAQVSLNISRLSRLGLGGVRVGREVNFIGILRAGDGLVALINTSGRHGRRGRRRRRVFQLLCRRHHPDA